jgi:hypothetical protein
MSLKDDYDYIHDELDNRPDEIKPNNDAYWPSRGEDGLPDDCEHRIK